MTFLCEFPTWKGKIAMKFTFHNIFPFFWKMKINFDPQFLEKLTITKPHPSNETSKNQSLMQPTYTHINKIKLTNTRKYDLWKIPLVRLFYDQQTQKSLNPMCPSPHLPPTKILQHKKSHKNIQKNG